MKNKIITITIFSFLSILLFANTDSLSLKIKNEIKSIVNESNYTRVPNNDFENIIDSRISKAVDDKFNFWIILIGVFIASLTTLASIAFKFFINKKVEEQVKLAISTRLDDINLTKKYLYKIDLVTLKDKFTQGYSIEEIISSARNILKNAENIGDSELIFESIDILISLYYKVYNVNEIEKLLDKYDEKLFLVQTYINIALMYSDLYENNGSQVFKNRCLTFCDLVQQKAPYHGDSYGTKILIYGIDLDRETDKDKSDDLKLQIKEIIKEVTKGSSPLTAFSTLNRLNMTRGIPNLNKYIINLEKDTILKDEFDKINKRSEEYNIRFSINKTGTAHNRK